MKKVLIILLITVMVLLVILFIYPRLEFNIDNKIIKFSYSDDISEFEDQFCYDESYVYNKKRNVSIHGYEFKKFLFFHIIILKYKEGNVCDTEYVLEPNYIENFINNAVIKYNTNNIDLPKLIEGKTPIISNTRYFDNDYQNSIDYILDGKHQVLYVFYVDDLLVIQVGLSDEGPKFIAYK